MSNQMETPINMKRKSWVYVPVAARGVLTTTMKKKLKEMKINGKESDWSPVMDGIQSDWSLMMDGIQVEMPSSSQQLMMKTRFAQPKQHSAETSVEMKESSQPTMEEVDTYISEILYGPRRTRRLPIFEEFCPD